MGDEKTTREYQLFEIQIYLLVQLLIFTTPRQEVRNIRYRGGGQEARKEILRRSDLSIHG
jgi:hypothetical protein